MLDAYFLEQFRLRVDDHPFDVEMRSPARSLFAFLSLNPDRKFRREVLAAELWGHPPMDIMKRLRQALHEINRAFDNTPLSRESFLTAKSGTVEFNGKAPFRSDVHAFMALTNECLSDTPSQVWAPGNCFGCNISIRWNALCTITCNDRNGTRPSLRAPNFSPAIRSWSTFTGKSWHPTT